jgi:hypothetical protein
MSISADRPAQHPFPRRHGRPASLLCRSADRPALDAFLDLKTPPDPLIQASARRTADYLRAGTAGLDAMHGIPCATFACFSRSRAARRWADLRRQVEEQLAKMAIRRLAPQETVSFYRRIFNGLFSAAAGGFADRPDGTHVRPIRKQIIDAGPDLAFEGPEVFLGNQVARCLTPRSPARRITAERANRLLGGMRGAAEDSDQIGGRSSNPQHSLRSLAVRDPQARADPLGAKGRRLLCRRGRQADRGNRLGAR